MTDPLNIRTCSCPNNSTQFTELCLCKITEGLNNLNKKKAITYCEFVFICNTCKQVKNINHIEHNNVWVTNHYIIISCNGLIMAKETDKILCGNYKDIVIKMLDEMFKRKTNKNINKVIKIGETDEYSIKEIYKHFKNDYILTNIIIKVNDFHFCLEYNGKSKTRHRKENMVINLSQI